MTSRFEQKKYRQGYSCVIGCDEVGRGSLAGPVVAAAVVMKPETWSMKREIRDSKMLTPEQRTKLEPLIKQHCLAWGIGAVGEKIIDKINIHRATLLAMRRAVGSLIGVILNASASEREESLIVPGVKGSFRSPFASAKAMADKSDALRLGRDGTDIRGFLYVDGKFTIPDLSMEQEAVVGGDGKILSIAAASIIAKVYRDNLMRKLHEKYPIYNFAQHKGYGTLYHRKMIISHGLSQIHRQSFCENLTV